MVQSILSDMVGDEVNSINDTVESEAVALIVRDSYFELINRRNWPHLKKLIQVDNSIDATKPTHLAIPEKAKELILVNYDVHKFGETRVQYQPITYQYADDFLARINARNSDQSNIDIIEDFSGTQLLIRNDTAPQFWTSFDDRFFVFDAYDNTVDSTIQASKMQVQAYMTPNFFLQDDFLPDLPEEAFTLLLEEAKSMAFINLKQMVNEKAEGRARKADSWMSRQSFTLKGGVRYGNYGRNNRPRMRKQPLEKNDSTPS